MENKQKKCIIVGNSSALLEKNKGSFIDDCDKVIRMNWFEIKGFEKDVGTKLDIYATGPTQIKDRSKDFCKQFNEIWFPWPYGNRFHKVKKLWTEIKSFEEWLNMYNIDQNKLHCCSENLLNDVKKYCQDNDPTKYGPSTGFVIINMALQKFPDHQIYIIGFDQWKGGWYWLSDKENELRFARSALVNMKAGGRHSSLAEQKRINELIKEGKIIRY